MKKILSSLSAVVILFSLIALPVSPVSASKNGSYDYQIVSQSGYPTVGQDGTSLLWIKIKNTGTATWNKDIVRLGTASPLDRPSEFRDNYFRWISDNRILMDKDSVAPGEEVAFAFYIKIPLNQSPGIYQEYFRPVADGIGWMKDTGIYWDVTVVEISEPLDTVHFGNDFSSFVNASKTCTASTASSQFDFDVEGLKIKMDLEFSIQPVTDICRLTYTLLSAEMSYSDEVIQRLIDEGSTMEEINQFMETMNENTKDMVGSKDACTGSGNDFHSILTDWASGSLYTVYAYDEVECITIVEPGSNNKPITPATQDYDFEYVDQTSHIDTAPGQLIYLGLTIRNTGKRIWYKGGNNPLYLGASNPQDRIPLFLPPVVANDNVALCAGSSSSVISISCVGRMESMWMSRNRVSMSEQEVAPGENAHFRFYYNVPNDIAPGVYKEYFRPVVENITWLKDIGIYWQITVK